MRKMIKWLLIIGSTTLIALLFLFLTFFRLEETASTQHQMLGEILWISAPDGGVGFKILESNHPNYRVNAGALPCLVFLFRHNSISHAVIAVSSLSRIISERGADIFNNFLCGLWVTCEQEWLIPFREKAT